MMTTTLTQFKKKPSRAAGAVSSSKRNRNLGAVEVAIGQVKTRGRDGSGEQSPVVVNRNVIIVRLSGVLVNVEPNANRAGQVEAGRRAVYRKTMPKVSGTAQTSTNRRCRRIVTNSSGVAKVPTDAGR